MLVDGQLHELRSDPIARGARRGRAPQRTNDRHLGIPPNQRRCGRRPLDDAALSDMAMDTRAWRRGPAHGTLRWMIRRVNRWPALLPATIILATCGGAAIDDSSGLPSAGAGGLTPTPGQSIPVATAEMPTQDAGDPGVRFLVEMSRGDLAKRLGIAPDHIEVVEARAVMWPDASLGCPRPGMAYKQVPEDGALVRLSAGGRTYEYHSGGRRAPFLCENPAR